MDRVAIWAYNNGSESARLLAEKLDVNIIRKTNSRFRWRSNWTVINWGTSNVPTTFQGRVVNSNHSVHTARCKTYTLTRLATQGVNHPEFTTSLQEALGWLQTGDVVCRATTTGHEGIGLSIAPRGSQTLPTVPLYTKYVKKISEWRVHVAFGETIHVQKKVRRRGAEGDARIRNTANGFVFTSRDIQVPNDLEAQAKGAVRALGLDFGAVDLVYNGREDKVYVLEVNTAPGIEGVTLEKYAEAFKKELTVERIQFTRTRST